MATFKTISIDEAPASTAKKQVTEEMKLFDGFIRSIKQGFVGELEPDDGETTRAMKVRASHAAKRVGVTVETWDANGKVYVKVTGKAKTEVTSEVKTETKVA